VKRFHQEVVLIPNLEEGVAYTSFLNGLKSRRFKFSLAEQKEITLAEALRKAADFIRAIEIYVDSLDARRKGKTPTDRNPGRGDRGQGSGYRRPRLEVINLQFITNPRSILMEVRDHPMLNRPPPMTSEPKTQNA